MTASQIKTRGRLMGLFILACVGAGVAGLAQWDAAPPLVVEYSSDESTTNRLTRSQELRQEERAALEKTLAEKGEQPPYKKSDFALALETGNAGVLAELLTLYPDALEAERAKDRLTRGTIYCLERNGHLADYGDPILLSAFGLYCEERHRPALEKLELDLAIEKKSLYVRYLQDYTRGYGRKVDDKRLAPHPKRVRIRLSPIVSRQGETETLKLDLDTPRVELSELGESGLTDEDVWNRTLEQALEKIREALGVPKEEVQE